MAIIDDDLTRRAAEFSCRIDGSRGCVPILSLGSLPLANALPRASELASVDARYPLELVFSPSTTLVQIMETVPPEHLFGDYVYFSSFSDTMVEHAHAEGRPVGVRPRLRTMCGDSQEFAGQPTVRGQASGETGRSLWRGRQGAILLNYCGFGAEVIGFVADRPTDKQGRFVPGVRLPMVVPTRFLEPPTTGDLRQFDSNFGDENMAQPNDFQRRGGRFILSASSPRGVER